MERRILYFDYMKGVAIILVVIGHVIQFSYNYDSSDVVKMLGIFHMPIFFYISGYFMYSVIPDSKTLVKKFCKRSLNLLVPYIVFGALWCVFSGSNYVNLLVSGGERYWFLWVLFLLSAFFILYGYLLQRVKKEWIYICLWIVPYLAIIAGKILEKNGDGFSLLSVGHLNTYYRYYLIGYLCRRYMKLNSVLFNNDIVYAFGLLLYFLQWRYCNIHNIALIFFGGMGAIIVLQQYFERKRTTENRMLRTLSIVGSMSLPIYVIHYFFIPDVSGVMHNLIYAAGGGFIWQLSFSLLLTLPIIGASMFVGQLIENNKYLNFVFFGRLF